MEKVGVSKQRSAISVLTEGKKLANELKGQLHPSTASRETCYVLLESILSSYENAIALLAQFEPPNSVEGSPRRSHQNSNDHLQSSKKRKSLPRWSETGSEGQLHDGYNWRKYGQKDILGAVHPRAYYGCTHRNTQGCLATKHVQRADEDPSIFKVIYKGKHSCRLKQKKKKNEEKMVGSPIKTDPIFSVPSTPIEYQSFKPHFFSDTSDSYFSLSPCPMNGLGIAHTLQTTDSDFGEIILNPSEIVDFPWRDLDLSIDAEDFDCHFLDY